MAHSKEISTLINTMSKLVQHPGLLTHYIEEVGLNSAMFSVYTSSPFAIWNELFNKTITLNRLERLLAKILADFPLLPEAVCVLNNNQISNQKELKFWRNTNINYQKIIEKQDTFLPISFLSLGTKASKSVCKIIVKKSNTGKNELASGFVIDGDFLVTNNHVISSTEEAKNAEVIFNYELSENNLPLEPDFFKLDPLTFFKTSENENLDLTIVKIHNFQPEKYGYLKISSEIPKAEEFVNIIQHPSGEYKKIAMFHNVVVYSDDNIVQYLTDTRNGSSGSPVFNSNWEVIAVHHAGGFLKEPNSEELFFRNQGINANKIKELKC